MRKNREITIVGRTVDHADGWRSRAAGLDAADGPSDVDPARVKRRQMTR